MKKDQRKSERRTWASRPTYPLIDNGGVLTIKNRRRRIDRREVLLSKPEIVEESDSFEAPPMHPSTHSKVSSKQQKLKNTTHTSSESGEVQPEEIQDAANKSASRPDESISETNRDGQK